MPSSGIRLKKAALWQPLPAAASSCAASDKAGSLICACTADSLHEVAIDGSPHSATSPHFGADGFAGGSPWGSPDGKRGQKIMSGLKGMVNSARGR